MLRYLPSLQTLARSLGMPPISDEPELGALLPYLELMRAEGAVVLLKLDGQRGPTDNPPYTALVNQGKLGAEFFRTDADSLVEATAYVIVSYARACWDFHEEPSA